MKAKMPKPTKLTNTLRHKLADALTRQAYGAAQERTRALGRTIAEAALVANYGEDWEKKFNKLPEGWLPKLADVRVFSSTLQVHVSLGRLVPLPNLLVYGRIMFNDDKLMREYEELEKHKSDNFSRGMYRRTSGRTHYVSHFRKNMEDALSAITTEEELQQQWPEAFDLLQGMKQTVEPPPTTPLAIPIANIIEMYRNSLAAKPQEAKEEDNVPAN